jgi:methylated-DNA-protein-cysteine methyltransferase-like protein
MNTLFSKRVVDIARAIPTGRVTTYGTIAKLAQGGTMASRSITAILGKAYENGIKDIPFHRIVYSGGKVWTSEQYDAKRKKLYKQEGIEIDEKGFIKNFRDVLWEG